MAGMIIMARPKGGVGRTTTAFRIAAGPAKLGGAAPVVDVDVASSFGVGAVPRTMHLAGKLLADSVAETSLTNLDALPDSQSFADADALSASSRHRASTLHSLILRDLQINERRPARG